MQTFVDPFYVSLRNPGKVGYHVPHLPPVAGAGLIPSFGRQRAKVLFKPLRLGRGYRDAFLW